MGKRQRNSVEPSRIGLYDSYRLAPFDNSFSGPEFDKKRRTINQLLRDFKNIFPSENPLGRQNGASQRVYIVDADNPQDFGVGVFRARPPMAGWYFNGISREDPYAESLRVLFMASRELAGNLPASYIVLATVYLHPDAGDRDWDFYRTRYPGWVVLHDAGIDWLTKRLAGVDLVARFATGIPPPTRKRLNDKYGEIDAYYKKMRAAGRSAMKALEMTMDHFGCGKTTVYTARQMTNK